MKVTYTGKTVRNNKERTVTYTGGVGTPSVKNGVTATYIGGKQSKAVYDAEAKTREARRNAAETQQSTGREVGDISALGAGNYGADKRIFGDGYNVGQGLAKAGQIGLTQIAKAGSSAGAWLENQLGNFAREGTNGYWDPDTSKWLFNRWNQAIDAEAHGVQQRYAENTQRGGRAAEVFEDMGAATVAAIPQAVAAVLTGGASAAAQSGALAERAAATPGLVGTISRGMRAMAKDPNFQLSFVQVFGPGYEQAKADGADDLRASLYAVGNGLMNAAVEVGGGIQTLPKELQTGGNAWKSWVDSMLDEGKEEVVQGVIERAMQNTVYGRDNPYIGVGNGAIFDPAAAAEEFAGGAVVGGLLGGGQIGLNTLANRAAYNAEKAQYDRDVRQNTAPEMDSKAAQAVDAVTRGERITGNQAAAIAKNPVAVETLEANTGVKLNTQQPISQLKRDIAALASRDTTQKQPQGTTSTTVAQRRAQKPTGGFLEAGQKAYQEMSRTAEDVPTLYAGFSSVYNAGLNGIEASKVKGAYAAMLTPEQRYAAYNAGLEDAAAQVARENAEVKSVTTTAGAGLADNVYSRAVIAKSKRTAATLNAMGKKLGVRIEFVDSVMGGQANGQYIRDKNLIQIAVDSNKPYLNVAAHEVTHRMQDLSPAEYRKFRQAAMEHHMREKGIDEMAEVVEWYREKAESSGVTLTQNEVMDEIAADFAGNMMENPDLFREFSQSNRTAAQKLLDSLKEFIAKVKSIFTGKARDAAAQEAYGKDFAELEAVAQKWQEAFDAAEQQAERAKTAAGEGDGRMMLKDYSYDALVRKPGMTLVVVEDADGLTRKEVIDKALEEAKKYGGVNQNGNVYVHVNDTDADVIISAKALRHGLDRRFAVNAPATLKVGEILQNAVRVNELVPKLDTVDATYVLMGAAKNKNNEPYIVQFVVNRASNEVMSVDVLYAINAKTEPAGSLSPEITGVPATLTGSSISISDLLTYVNRYFPDVLPESVLRHFGHSERPAGKLGEGALFSLKATDSTGRNLSEQQQAFFKDSKVRDAEGRLKVMYRGGYETFTVFDRKKSKYSNLYGRGFYFTDSESHAKQYGNVKAFYLNITRPVSTTETTITKPKLKKFLEAVATNEDDFSFENYGYGATVDSVLESVYGKSDFAMLYDINQTAIGDMVAAVELFNEVNGTDYDGLILDTETVAFRSEQIKDVDNLNPTSNPDIGYQLRSTADIEQEMRDLKRERTVLASRNRALEQRVQDLKGEMRISKEPSVVLRDVKRLGLDTIRRYYSDVKYADIQTDMEALGKAVMKKDVSMSDLMPYAKRVAEKIVDNTAELTENGAELLEIRDYLKRQKILFNGELDHYNEFRKQHIGTMKLNKTEGTPVDTIYAEMTEMFGEGYFPSDVYTEADKLYRIADVLDGMDAIYQNPFAGYRDAAVQEIANDIIDGMISDQVRQKKTYADRVALEKQEAVGRVREMLYKEREKRKGQIKQLRKEYNEKTQKGREKRYATEMRARIARHTGSISEKLLRPTDKKHIPEELRVVVADLLRNINMESAYSYDENGRLRKNAGGDPTRRTQEAVKLKKAYEDIIAREGNMVVDPDLLDSGGLLDSLAALGGKRIADMNVAELETVWNAVRSIEATLTSYDRTLANQKYARTSEWADSLMMGSMSRKRRNRKISLDMADPYTFFSAYGDGGMQIYRTLRNAQDREHVMLTELREAAKKFLDADVYKNRFERHTFTTSRGVELTLTNEQIMNLYNLAKRGEQSMNHLMVGGIVQPEIKRYGKLKAIPRGTENILLTLEDVRAITSVLTPEQIKVADGLQKLASTKLAEWGNEASMAVYGYRKFMEAHYWPIKTAKEATASSVEKGPDIAREIKNMGSAKALTPNASNALDIGGVYDVFAQNASDMIKYATLLAPMEDINRLYNYRYRDSMGNLTGKNVRQVLSGVYGDAAQSYWRNLMRDVQNGMVKNASATTRAVERIVGNTKGAAVGANLRVVIQQPTAYFRAAVALDPEYMVKGVKKGVTAGNGWDKARRWAPIAGIKDTSGFDQGSRYTIAREVYGTDGGVLEWLNDKSMALAGKADAVTWGKIWNACEWQVASETNLEVGSDAYYRQVAAVFTDVIDQTQVVDGIMQRAQIMRDSDALTRQATSFMGEPLKSLNMFMRAYDAWAYENNPQKRSSALKKLKRSVAALVVTDAVNALAQSIVDGLRDDDKDKNWAERILEAFTGYSGDEENAGEAVKNVVLGGNLISNMNPAGRIPYVKDILSILQGYTVDRMDAAAADDIIRTAKTFIKGLNGDAKTTTAYNLKQVMLMCSKVFGISIGNMGRDMWAIARSIASDTGNVRLMFEMEKAIYRMDKSAGNRKRWCELLYRAQKDNDTETARLIYKEMLEHGYEETDVRQGVEAIMKAEQKVKSVDDLKNRWRAP